MAEEKRQVKSKQRVADHGEVFTAEREVNAMLDLVKNESERIESRFLEPACGDGNFLVKILERKLASVQRKYHASPADFEMWSVIAVMNIYGVELLADNAAACRERLFRIWDDVYTAHNKAEANDECRAVVRFILEKNILCGDALSLKQNNGEPIVFAEWSFASGTLVKRRDFRFDQIFDCFSDLPLFDLSDNEKKEDIFIPRPLREYPLTDYRKVAIHG